MIALLLLLSSAMPVDDARIDACLQQLEARDANLVEDCLRELRARPDASLERALPAWGELGRLARRRVARILAEHASADLLSASLLLATDPDREVREAWITFLGRTDHADQEKDERARLLGNLVREEPERQLRLDALTAIASLGGEAASRELERELFAGGLEERRMAAALLSDVPQAAPRILSLVQTAFADPDQSSLDSEMLALLLPAYGRRLAERAGAGGTELERLPLVEGDRHPAPHVRRGARAGFEAMIVRLRSMGAGERALRLLDQLAEDGFDRRIALDQEVRIALSWGSDPEFAIRAAEEFGKTIEPSRSTRDRALYARSVYLQGLGYLASGNPEAARRELRSAGDWLDGVLAERVDLETDDLSGEHTDAIRLRAWVELALGIAYITEGKGADDARVVGAMRRLHTLALELQKTDLVAGRGGFDSLDSILLASLSPVNLWFTGTDSQIWPASRCLEVQEAVGRALASVAPRELPGFEPATERTVPLDDQRRRSLLMGIHGALIDSIDDWIEELRQLGDDALARTQILRLRQRKVILLRELRAAQDEGDWSRLLDHRSPCTLVLWQVRGLRAEGKTKASRELALEARKGLEDTGQYQDNSVLAAELEMAVGASWTDENEPERAERELTRALERLEALETTQAERGADARTIAQIKAMRSEALVSLAVNANVKLLDADKALGYFERAYELRQDGFMQVLLACYRARSGRDAEARAALSDVVPVPNLYYNLACTWALLGETQQALDYLQRELEENHVSLESRNRQRDWARDDPDLASLRDDLRFRALLEHE